MCACDEWIKRAALAAYALATLQGALEAAPATQFNLRLLEIARQGISDVRV